MIVKFGLRLLFEIGQYAISTIGEAEIPTLPEEALPFPWLPVGFNGRLVPFYYETKVFGPDGDPIEVQRYDSREEAIAGHEEMTRYWREILVRTGRPVE